MIKFFRVIRQKLVQENRVGKYLIYAVGEIVLVIIGILIALSLNKANEAKTQEKKVEAILRQIQGDLITTIEDSKAALEFYREKDSLVYLVMNNKVSKADYKNPENNALYLLWSYDILLMQNDGFNSLMLKSEVIPDRYTNLVKGLKNLYLIRKELADFHNDKLEEEMTVALNYLRTNHAGWMGDYLYSRGALPDEAIDYYLNDDNHKYSLTMMTVIAHGFMENLISVRIDAIKYIREIDALLKEDKTYPFDYNAHEYSAWIGKYHSRSDTMQIAKYEARLKVRSNNGEWQEIYPLSKIKFHLSNEWFTVFNNDINGEIEGYTTSFFNTRRFWKKIK